MIKEETRPYAVVGWGCEWRGARPRGAVPDPVAAADPGSLSRGCAASACRSPPRSGKPDPS